MSVQATSPHTTRINARICNHCLKCRLRVTGGRTPTLTAQQMDPTTFIAAFSLDIKVAFLNLHPNDDDGGRRKSTAASPHEHHAPRLVGIVPCVGGREADGRVDEGIELFAGNLVGQRVEAVGQLIADNRDIRAGACGWFTRFLVFVPALGRWLVTGMAAALHALAAVVFLTVSFLSALRTRLTILSMVGWLAGVNAWVSFEEDFAVWHFRHFCDEFFGGCRQLAVLREAVD